MMPEAVYREASNIMQRLTSLHDRAMIETPRTPEGPIVTPLLLNMAQAIDRFGEVVRELQHTCDHPIARQYTWHVKDVKGETIAAGCSVCGKVLNG